MRSGHFVNFDRRLREQALANGSSLLLVGHRRFERGDGYEPWMLPWFDRRTSGSHIVDPTNVAAFNEQTAQQLKPILEGVTDRFARPQVFWYLGAAEYVPVIEILAHQYPTVSWHLHLFWDFLVDRSDIFAVRRFRELLARVELLPNVRLTLGTETLLEDFNRVLVNAPLRLLPDGPSVSIPDHEARARILAESVCRGDAPALVLCPGGHAVGKNWTTGASVLAALVDQHRGRFEGVLRLVESQASRAEVRLARSLDDDLDIVRGLLPDEDLVAMFDDADVVFLPYGTELFQHRSSGLLTEAIISGARIVCFEGTYLSWVVDHYGLGSSVSEFASIDTCVAAIVSEAERARSGDPDEQASRLNYLSVNSWCHIYAEIMGSAT
jgi:hypothetical protein